jgi:hypothetical protein
MYRCMYRQNKMYYAYNNKKMITVLYSRTKEHKILESLSTLVARFLSW